MRPFGYDHDEFCDALQESKPRAANPAAKDKPVTDELAGEGALSTIAKPNNDLTSTYKPMANGTSRAHRFMGERFANPW